VFAYGSRVFAQTPNSSAHGSKRSRLRGNIVIMETSGWKGRTVAII